jgi:hypothetical protein
VGIKSRLARTAGVGVLTPDGDRDEEEVRSPGLRADSARHFVAIHHGHADIQQRYIGWGLLCVLERQQPIGGGIHLVTQHLQKQGRSFQHIAVVIREQNAPACRRRSLGAPPERALTGFCPSSPGIDSYVSSRAGWSSISRILTFSVSPTEYSQPVQGNFRVLVLAHTDFPAAKTALCRVEYA